MLKGSSIFTTTFILANGLNVEHESVMRLLKRHSNVPELSRFAIGEVRTKGRPIKVAYLDELQSTILITLMKNSPGVIDFKIKLSKAFFKQQKLLQQLLAQKNNAEWLEKRNKTKEMRHELMDMIQRFVVYAKEQGSKSAEKYYMALSRMELTGLFIMEQKYPNARDVMSMRQLNLIEMADEVIANALNDGMIEGLNYKECYKKAKERIEKLSQLIPPSPLPQLILKMEKPIERR
jgi:hypothetical protein